MKLRPHHILDILRDYGNGRIFTPHPYGHALHIVAPKLLSHLDIAVELVLGADDICQPCQHLQADDQCDDVLSQLEQPISKQMYNDKLDTRLFSYLELKPGVVLSMQAFLERVRGKTPGIEKVCTHPQEDERVRLDGITHGLEKLGIPA